MPRSSAFFVVGENDLHAKHSKFFKVVNHAVIVCHDFGNDLMPPTVGIAGCFGGFAETLLLLTFLKLTSVRAASAGTAIAISMETTSNTESTLLRTVAFFM